MQKKKKRASEDRDGSYTITHPHSLLFPPHTHTHTEKGQNSRYIPTLRASHITSRCQPSEVMLVIIIKIKVDRKQEKRGDWELH